MTIEDYNDLLDKYLNDNATDEEIKILETIENLSISEVQKTIFENEVDKLEVRKSIYKGLKRKIGHERSTWPMVKIAASIILIVSMGSISLFSLNTETTFITNNSKTYKVYTLKDGSEITLNANSSLDYNNNSKGFRRAYLEGEAFFKIARNKKKPFVITTGKVQTRVLGTSFNIRETDSIIVVTVATGLVEVSDADSSVKLTPNQRVSYHVDSKIFRERTIDFKLFTSWLEENIELKEVSMQDLASLIESRYGVRVVFIDKKAVDIEMTINIQAKDNLDTLLSNINFISELKLTKTKENEIEVDFKR